MSAQTSYSSGRLIVTRLYNAPRERVFEAWINTSQVEQWWGCTDTTDVKSEIDARIGGKFQHQMTIKGEFQSPLYGVITEYVPPSLLSYQVENSDTHKLQTVRVEFIERGLSTEVRLTHDNIPDEFSQYVVPGWAAALAKLEVFLIGEKEAV